MIKISRLSREDVTSVLKNGLKTKQGPFLFFILHDQVKTGGSVVVPKKALKLSVSRHLAKRRVMAQLLMILKENSVNGVQVVVHVLSDVRKTDVNEIRATIKKALSNKQ